jgi:NAD(P)-dependent dehydrogenase (short-subunit alcohol dehydrogenase family)
VTAIDRQGRAAGAAAKAALHGFSRSAANTGITGQEIRVSGGA